MEWLLTLLLWVGAPVLAYLVVRFATAAYFKSKSDFIKGEKRYGIREEEQ